MDTTSIAQQHRYGEVKVGKRPRTGIIVKCIRNEIYEAATEGVVTVETVGTMGSGACFSFYTGSRKDWIVGEYYQFDPRPLIGNERPASEASS